MLIYAIATLAAARVSWQLSGAERRVWGLAAVLMAFQVLNTPLDLHGLLWATGRCLAHIQGWYSERYAYQRDLLVVLAISSCALLLLGILVLRRDLVSNGLLVLGLGFSIGMTIVKGINYHHLEALYRFPVGPLRVPDLIELSGIASVLSAAYLKRKNLRTSE